MKKARGFTLIEFLVVIAITTIISGIMVVNFRKGEESNKLQRSAQQIVQAFRKAQNMAMSSVEFTSVSPPDVPIEGYGVRFRTADLASYIIFADTSDNTPDACDYLAIESPVETLNLESGIIIDSLYTYTTSPGVGLISRVNVLACFVPPDPKTSISSPSGASVGGIIINIKKQGVTCTSSSSDCRNIVVSKLSGAVSIGVGAIKL